MLSGLVSYSDSEEEGENGDIISDRREIKKKDVADLDVTKRTSDDDSERKRLRTDETEFTDSIDLTHLDKRQRTCGLLPLPDTIKQLYKERDSKHTDDSTQHGGRVRTFAHEEGNWATHVYIKCINNDDERLAELVTELLLCLRPSDFKSMAEHHISLSRTVTVRHHWIKSLTDSLRAKSENLQRCLCELTTLKLYTNEEKTRTFLAIEVVSFPDQLRPYIQAVDDCFQEFRLQKYYTDPSLHISIGWCLGDVLPQISEQHLQKLQDILSSYLEDNPDMKVMEVEEIHCKIGNKSFVFTLGS